VRCSHCASACPRHASAEQLRPHDSNFRCHATVPRLRRPMLVVRAEPGVKSDLLQATFECATCAYGETAVVKRRSSIAP
jgi:Na+-translocating ferredoxin:NAD+ oxidoreductase RnfC subunit